MFSEHVAWHERAADHPGPQAHQESSDHFASLSRTTPRFRCVTEVSVILTPDD
jgi:hypothetical protein